MGIGRSYIIYLPLLLAPLSAAQAQGVSPQNSNSSSNICFAAFASLRNGVVDVGRGVRDLGRAAGRGVGNYAQAIREEGWTRAFVRARTAEEQAQSYRDYFFPSLENIPNTATRVQRFWERLAHPTSFTRNGQRQSFSPSNGIVQSLDRWMMGETRTTTSPVRFIPVLGIAGVSGYYLQEYLYEKPLSAFERDQNFKGAVSFALDFEPAFAPQRRQIERSEARRQRAVSEGTMTGAQAEEERRKERRLAQEQVAAELISRKNFFEYVRLRLLENPNLSVEELAVAFMRGNPNDPNTRIDLRNPNQGSILRDPKARTVFRDLQRLFNPEFQQNFLLWEPGKKPDFDNLEVQERIFAQVFALNLDRMAGIQMISQFLERGFNLERIRTTDRLTYDVYQAFIADPYTKAMIEYQKRNPGKLSHNELLAHLMDDFEWTIRMAQVEAMGARFQLRGEVKTIDDYRREALQSRGIVLPP